MKPIEIKSNNIADYYGLEILAFHWSAAGACGEHGGVKFITSDRTVYHTNRVNPEYGVTMEDLQRVFPPLSHFHPGILGGGEYPPEWKDSYLGMGNYLVIHESIWDEFRELATSELRKKKEEGKNVILYNIWVDVVIKVLNKTAKPVSYDR